MRPSRLDPERWRRVDQIFDAALDVPRTERDDLLAEACAGDAELRAEVESLLAAQSRARERFEEPASLVAAGILGPTGKRAESRKIGQFRILREIGRGGMGVVYLAEDTRLGRYVALKALPPYLGVGPEAKRRFEVEARAVSALDHPNIATLHAIDESEEGEIYMVFAFYDGETLEARIARRPLPPADALEIATGIAEGLGAAHRSRIIHRDVKPSNVLLTEAGGIKLLDFGVAKVAGETLTGEGVRLGTLAYMSPEHAKAGALDARTDLWSLGVVLYEMLTGVRPFPGDDPASLISSILHREPKPVGSLRPELPDGLERIVDKLLCKDVQGRYQGTEDLLADLHAVRVGHPPQVAVREPPLRGRPRIERLAVLPLANLTGDPSRQYLVHGVHDALIAELGKIQALGVISRTSTLRFQDTEMSVPEIAAALDVDALVEGSVSRDGDELAITAQLIAASPERHLWAETYRRGMGGVLDVASEVARSIAAEVEITLSPDEERRLATSRPVKPAAYEAFTLGLFHLERRSPEGHDQAQKYLQRAIQIDPEFAPAYAVMAEAYGSAAFFGLASPAEGLPIARSLVDKALALDPTMAAAHTSLGAVRYFGEWNWAGAEAAFRQAIALNPSYAYAYFMLADLLSVLGRYSEALAAAERNSELERFVPFSAFGPVIVLNHMRDYDQAIERARAGLEFFTDFWVGHWLLTIAFLGKRMYREAVAECETAVEVSRGTPTALGALGVAYALDGRGGDAMRILGQLEKVADSVYVASSNFAMIDGALGEYDRAFDWLDRAYEKRDMALVHIGDHALWDSLRSDPRLAALLSRMGLDHTAGHAP
jgi:serine/threonine protein kinase/tetratricopeptide (TPR) repeat protein